MFEWLIGNSSYLGIILFLGLTGCGLPLPEELAIVAAGVAASAGTLHPWVAFVSCLAGALLGDCVMYAIGYHFGHNLAKKHPRFAHLLHAEREAKTEELMRRHGLKVFLISRFMVGLRSPIYLTAGILRISFRRFLLIDVLCATIVVGIFYWLSFYFGELIRYWILRLEVAVTLVVLLAIAGGAIYFWRRRQGHTLARQADAVAEAIAVSDVDRPSPDESRANPAEVREQSLV
jgi:membrane protein DedA with SNARE-associated domain